MTKKLSRDERIAIAKSLGPITESTVSEHRLLRRVDTGSYAGLVCKTHPELFGLRRLNTRDCYACLADKRAVKWATDAHKRAAHTARVRRLREAKDLNMRNAKIEAEVRAIADGKLEPAAWIDYASAEVVEYFFPNGTKS